MLNFSKILLPLDLEMPSLPSVHQAAALARHFHSELLLLHVIRPLSYLGLHELGHGTLLTEGVKQAEEKLDAVIVPELAGITAKRMVVKGDPGRLIVQIAQDQETKLIVMGAHGLGAVDSVLVGSVTAKVSDGAQCPVWTGSHLTEKAIRDLAIRSIVCAVDLSSRDSVVTRWGVALAAEFKARLTLAHVTPGVENYGPGGSYVNQEFRDVLVAGSNRRIEQLQSEVGSKAEVFIGSGSVSKVLNEAVKNTEADLLVVGRRATINRLGSSHYSILRDSQIPVLSV